MKLINTCAGPQVVVIDEADKLFEDGFVSQLDEVPRHPSRHAAWGKLCETHERRVRDTQACVLDTCEAC